MPGSSRMSEVDLSGPVEPEPTEEGASPRGHRRRRNVVVLGSAVLVAVLALAGTQLVLGARERSAMAHLDGVVGRLETAPVVLWETPEPVQTLWRGPLGDDTLAEVSLTQDGTKQLVALDTATGKPRWSQTLAPPSAARTAALAAGDAISEHGSCATTATIVVCLVTDGFTRWTNDSGIEVPATRTTLQVIDVADGSVVESWPATGSTFVLRGPDRAVTADRTDAGTEVAEYDLRTGERTWIRQIPSPSVVSQFGDGAELFGFGDHVGVQTSETSTLLDAHGEVVRDDLAAYPTTNRFHLSADHVLLVRGSGNTATTTVVAADGTSEQDVVAKGTTVDVATDDESLPGLLLTAGTGVNATDDATGELRWNAPDVQTMNVSAIVLRGAVYVSTDSDVVALDGATGATRWKAALQSPWDVLRTDGEHLVVLHWPVDESDEGSMVAYALDDGHEAWRAAYPEGVESVEAIGHQLYGWRGDGTLVALG